MSFLEQQGQRLIKAGEVIFHENDPGGSMFIIQSGKVEVSVTRNKRKVVLATLGKGAIFGEMSLIDHHPRSATVTAVTDVKCIEMSRMLFEKRMEQVPAWLRSFFQILVDRLRTANANQQAMSPLETAQRIVFLLANFLGQAEPDNLGRVTVPWKETAENIAFLLNLSTQQVDRVMNKLSLTTLAKSTVVWDRGRLFAVDNFQLFEEFAEFCKERLLAQTGKELSPDFEEKSPKELQLLKFIHRLVSEQATASDLHLNFLEERCQTDLKQSLDDFQYELKTLLRKGILQTRKDQEGGKYYVVNRDLLAAVLGVGEKVEMFEQLEVKLS
jgi:CRP-like cAMP-binding protein